MRKILFLLSLLFVLKTNAKVPDNIQVFLKNGTTVNGPFSITAEKNLLPLKKIQVDATSYPLAQIDSFKVNSDRYAIIPYKDTLHVARILFKGESEGYKILTTDPVYLLRKHGEEKLTEITARNKFGVYNYYFKECLTKDSSVVKKKTNSMNDYILMNEVVNKLNCKKLPYTVYKKYEKSRFYIFVQGGLSLWKPIISADDGNFLAEASKKAKPGYFIGGGFLGNVNKQFDILLAMSYANNTATFHDEQTNTSPITYNTLYNGTFKFKALNADINFRYRFLKHKVSPFISGGIRFSYKMQRTMEYAYTNEFSNVTTNFSETLYSAALGLNVGAGCNYDIIKRLSVFINVGYTFGFGLYGPLRYSIKESDLNAGAGIMVRLNK